MKTKDQEIADETVKATAIMTAVEMASNFQLYSYRIIGDQAFIDRQIQLAKDMLKSLK